MGSYAPLRTARAQGGQKRSVPVRERSEIQEVLWQAARPPELTAAARPGKPKEKHAALPEKRKKWFEHRIKCEK